MSAQEQRDRLDMLTRHVQQTTKDWPERPARLTAALEAGWRAANFGVDVEPALAELKAAWDEAAPQPEPEPAPAEPPPEPPAPTEDEPGAPEGGA